jgi:hypothetical protein
MTMATEKHSARAPASSTDIQSPSPPSEEAPPVEVLTVPDDAVVVVTCRVSPSAKELHDTMAVVRKVFPKNKVLIVNGNVNVSLLTDQQLRSLGLTRLH